MKTIKLITALSLALFFAGLTSVFAQTDGPITSGIAKLPISYVVNIEHNADLTGYGCTYYVSIADENGRMVAPAQLFHLGTWTYTFREFSEFPVKVRIARMEQDPRAACPGTYKFDPVTLPGPFMPGRQYTFKLAPVKQ